MAKYTFLANYLSTDLNKYHKNTHFVCFFKVDVVCFKTEEFHNFSKSHESFAFLFRPPNILVLGYMGGKQFVKGFITFGLSNSKMKKCF